MAMDEEEGVCRLPLRLHAGTDLAMSDDSDNDDPIIKKMAAKLLELVEKTEDTQDIKDYIVLPKKEKETPFSSQLESGITEEDTYLKTSAGTFVVLNDKKSKKISERTMDISSGADLAVHAPKIGKRKLKKIKKKEREKTKGDAWFNLPALEMTEERKKDLELLQMRGALDPKHFYKKNDWKALPKYYQIGTVVDSPTNFYTDRIPTKERKGTLVDELLADAEFKKYNKRKYTEIIEDKSKREGRKFKGKKKKK